MLRLAMLLLLAGTLLLNACAPQPADCARKDVLCVGLVTDYGRVDTGIAHEAWLALLDLKEADEVNRVDAIETVDALDRAANIRVFADAGYDVIVTVGASIASETTAAAADYPKISFIGVEQPQPKVRRNVSGLVFREDKSGFLAGALAARITETGHVAAICEAQFVEPMRRYCDGFKAGANYADQTVGVSVAYRNGPANKLFNDPDWGSQAALQALQGGADVVFAAGGGTADAALQTAAGQGAHVIGAETDVYGSLATIRPELLTSATSDVRTGVVRIVRLLGRGKFPDGQFMGDVKLAPWHDLDRQIPESVKNELRTIAKDLDAGTLETGIPYQKP